MLTNDIELSTEKVESIEGTPRSWVEFHQLLRQPKRQPAKPFDIVRSTSPVMQNSVPWHQAVARRDGKGDRLSVTGVPRPMAFGAHRSCIGGEYQPELATGDIRTRSVVCWECDVGQTRDERYPSGESQCSPKSFLHGRH